MALFEGFFYYW